MNKVQGTARDERPQANALVTLETQVDKAWIDYNDHMTEWQYYKVLSDAGESFLRALGFTEEYRLRGFSFFSVEGHLRNLKECRVGSPLRVFTEILGYDDIRLHIFQYITDTSNDVTIATGEHMMLHVNTEKRRAVPIDYDMRLCLEAAYARWHATLRPRGMGFRVQAIRTFFADTGAAD